MEIGPDVPILGGLGELLGQLLGGKGGTQGGSGSSSGDAVKFIPDFSPVYGDGPPSDSQNVSQNQSRNESTSIFNYQPGPVPQIPTLPGIPWWLILAIAGITAYAVAPNKKRG